MLTGGAIAGIVVGSVVIFLVGSVALLLSILIPKLKHRFLESLGRSGVPKKVNGELRGKVSPGYVVGFSEDDEPGSTPPPKSPDDDPEPNPLPNPPDDDPEPNPLPNPPDDDPEPNPLPNPPPPPKTKLAHPNTELGYENLPKYSSDVGYKIEYKDRNIKRLKSEIEGSRNSIKESKKNLVRGAQSLKDALTQVKVDTPNNSNRNKIDSQKTLNERVKQNLQYVNNFFKFVSREYKVKIDLDRFEESKREGVQDAVDFVFRGMMFFWQDYIMSILGGEDIENKLKDEVYRDCLSVSHFKKEACNMSEYIQMTENKDEFLSEVFRNNMDDIKNRFISGGSPGLDKDIYYYDDDNPKAIGFCMPERQLLWGKLEYFTDNLPQYSSNELSLKKNSEELPKEEAERTKLEEYKVKLEAYEAQLLS